MMITREDIIRSGEEDGRVYDTPAIMDWIRELNENTHVEVKPCSIRESDFWFYDEYQGEVLNRKSSFFSVVGMRQFDGKEFIKEQPVIVQPEIGYLGIICTKIDGVLHFLMQAKIEPGNVNCIQISPTIQATKSNFLRAHGGKLPLYFTYFENSGKYEILYDQVQSEQASRFYKKRNRNIIICVNEDIEPHPNFRFMTLKQIHELMKVDNLVNMDSRTVLSGLAFAETVEEPAPQEKAKIYNKLNDYKMFTDHRVMRCPLYQLVDWEIDEYGIRSKKPFDFGVGYYDIEIEGREVRSWTQPLFVANGKAVFGLITREKDGRREYLIRLKPEIGSFDKVEYGPTIQWEYTHDIRQDNYVDDAFRRAMTAREGRLVDVTLSEEGGRFYHEQNKNLIIEVPSDWDMRLPEDYIWVDKALLRNLINAPHVLNIQLRNLLSLI